MLLAQSHPVMITHLHSYCVVTEAAQWLPNSVVHHHEEGVGVQFIFKKLS